jgi:hypothetical protein
MHEDCNIGCGGRRIARLRHASRHRPDVSLDPMFIAPEQFARRLKSDYDKYEKVIKVSGAKIG